MRKKLLPIIVLLVPIAAILMAGSGASRSDGAPVSSTGAPEETTCAMAGCHSDNTVNAGTATPEITIDGNPNSYEPGKTYTITTKISDADRLRFGFQLVALNESNENAGKFTLLDENRTQILKNYLKLLDREYVTYTYPGTEAVSKGLGEWSFNWTAPAQDIGTVKFYAAFASANNDKTDKGDNIYTKELMLSSPSSSGVKPGDMTIGYCFTARTDVNAQAFQITFTSKELIKTVIQGYDLNGKAVTLPTIVQLESGTTSVKVPWLGQLSKGFYLIRIQAGNRFVTKKVTVQ